jgi:hypothetical protein
MCRAYQLTRVAAGAQIDEGTYVKHVLQALVITLGCLGCDRQRDSDRPVTTPSVALQTATTVAAPPLVDEATVSRCELRHACGMSHPGLGSFEQATSVDLGSCVKTSSSASGAFEGPPLDASSASAPISAADCATLKKLVVDITADDVKREQEAAQVDTTACTLTVTCKPDIAPKVSVQRQTLTGGGHVVKLIAALQRAR